MSVVSPEIRKVADADDRRNAYSTLVMPNGSLVCIGHDAPYDLGVSMNALVFSAWELTALREWEGQPHEGNYYCPRCSCRKSGYWQELNGTDPSCEDGSCLCHREDA